MFLCLGGVSSFTQFDAWPRKWRLTRTLTTKLNGMIRTPKWRSGSWLVGARASQLVAIWMILFPCHSDIHISMLFRLWLRKDYATPSSNHLRSLKLLQKSNETRWFSWLYFWLPKLRTSVSANGFNLCPNKLAKSQHQTQGLSWVPLVWPLSLKLNPQVWLVGPLHVYVMNCPN